METEFRGVINSRLQFNSDLKLSISGRFMYTDYQTIECYDKDGNFLMNHTKKTPYSKEDSGFVEDIYSEISLIKTVFQKNFEFHKVIMFPYSRQEDLLKYHFYNSRFSLESIPFNRGGWHRVDEQEAFKYANTKEMCLVGTKNYSIFHEVGKGILEFDYQKYKSNKDEFIKNNPDVFKYGTDNIDYLFTKNLQIVADYFMCDVDYLKSKHFNIKTQIMKRLNYKINQKEAEMIKGNGRR
jgi:hypothetical protein